MAEPIRIWTDALRDDFVIYVPRINGYYYKYDGEFLEHRTEGRVGNEDDVYVCEEYNNNEFLNVKKINLTYEDLVAHAATIYGESAAGYGVVEKLELFAIASVHKINKIAYGDRSPAAEAFRGQSDIGRNTNQGMKHAIAAEINAVLGGQDYSNGAYEWDGAEQADIPADTPDILSNGRWLFKVNVYGWDISDEHYKSWKDAITKRFGANKFTAPQKKYAVDNYISNNGTYMNKDKIRLKSSAQYGLSIFWVSVNISKPRE